MNLASMPKAELHLHLEGSPHYSSLQKALKHHGVNDLPDFPYWYEPEFRYENFDHFREHMRDYITPWLSTPSGYAELIDEVAGSILTLLRCSHCWQMLLHVVKRQVQSSAGSPDSTGMKEWKSLHPGLSSLCANR